MQFRRFGLILPVMLLVALTMLSPLCAGAQDLQVLLNFRAPEGGYPSAGLVRDDAGNLYGTTALYGAYGAGTVFKLDPKGDVTVLHSFTLTESPSFAALLRDAFGNLYGTTTGNYSISNSYGTVFKLDGSGKFTLLYAFKGAPDGAGPVASVIQDVEGNLYGTTMWGGSGCFFGISPGCGTIFKLDQAGNETVLHRFEGPDGTSPEANLVLDREGNLYGTTSGDGAYGCGTVFELAVTGKFTVLHSFTGRDGCGSVAGLLRDPSGNLYGTTRGGYRGGGGTVFKLDRKGELTVLHAFSKYGPGLADGSGPAAAVIRDAAGNLYGTTAFGGQPPFDVGGCGVAVPCVIGCCGTVFKLSRSGEHTVLHRFQGSDGVAPQPVLVRDASGNLYGTALGGGTGNCLGGLGPCGTVFKITVEDEDSGDHHQELTDSH